MVVSRYRDRDALPFRVMRRVVAVCYFPFRVVGTVSKVPVIHRVLSIVFYGFCALAALALLTYWLVGGPPVPWENMFRLSPR